MHTESEARELWCPDARVALYVRGDAPDLERPVDLVGHGCNRMCTDDPVLTKTIQDAIDGTGGTKCISSRCMAWRWDRFGQDVPVPRGYCGRAGKP